MFTTEVKRVQNMLAELIHPSIVYEEGCPGKMIFFSSKKNSYFTAYVHQNHKCPAVGSMYALDDHDPDDVLATIKFSVTMWCNKKSPNGMDSIEADIIATHIPPHDPGKPLQKKCTDVKKHLSIVPDVKFLEDMYLDDMEKTATSIVIESRRLVCRLIGIISDLRAAKRVE